MKKITKILLCTLISVASYSAFAQVNPEQPLSGMFGNLNWTFNATDSTVTITGTGEMPDSARFQAYPWNGFFNTENAWQNNRQNIAIVVIGEGVTTIGRHAFQGQAAGTPQNLRSVTLPNTLIRIGAAAFNDCRALTAITIPAAVKYIDSAAFRNTSILASVNFEGTSQLEVIGAHAFVGSTVALAGTTLTSFTIPPTVHTIGLEAFRNRPLTSINIPASVRTIGTGAFERTHLTSFNVPATVTSWGSMVFAGTRITSEANVTFGDGIKHIPAGMFADINLTTMVLPATIETIGERAFAVTIHILGTTQISGIESFTFPPLVTEIADGLFNTSGAALDPNKMRNITIPNTITRIGARAFQATGLNSIVIPGSVTYIGDNAFFQCPRLASVTLNEGLDSIGTAVFRECPLLTTVNIPSTVTYIGAEAFRNSPITSAIVIPEGVTSIESSTFQQTRIPSVVIPNSVASIGTDAFRWNNSLTTVQIGSGIETIGLNAFTPNTGLETVTIRALVPPTTPPDDTLDRNVFPFTAPLPPAPTVWSNNIMLVVPDDAVATYQTAPVWQDFRVILAASIFDIADELRREIDELNKEIDSMSNELAKVDFFLKMVSEILGKDFENFEDIADAFMAIEDAIEDLLSEISDLKAELSACQANQSSVAGLSNAMLLEVHPNPVTNEMRITNEWASGDKVEIFNSRGQNVLTQQGGTPGTASELVIDMSSFQAGAYIVRVGNRIARVVKL